MKRIITVLICLTLVLSFFSCKTAVEPEQTGTETVTETAAGTETESETERAEEITYAEIDPAVITSSKKNTLETYGFFSEKQYEALSRLEKLAKESKVNLSFACYSLDGRSAFCYNSDINHSSACTIKAAYLLWLCKYLDETDIDVSTKITYTEDQYETGAGVIQRDEPGTKYSLEYLMTVCLSVSDNVAYNMLLDTFGREGYNEYMKSIGCDSLSFARSSSKYSSRCKAKDLAVVWVGIFNYLNSGSKHSSLLKKACTNTIMNYSTVNIKKWDYSHKSGENAWQLNDAGIIWKDTPYVLVVLYNDSYENNDNQSYITKLCDIIHFEIY